jgi:hypothetical protein
LACAATRLIVGAGGDHYGIVGLVQNKNDPEVYGGKGFAIAGIATGIGFFVLLFIYLLVVIGVSIFQ